MRSAESAKVALVTRTHALGLAAVFGLAACGADPRKDYDDWVADTNGKRGVNVGTGGSGGGAQVGCSSEAPRSVEPSDPLPDAAGLYVATCLANVSACDVEKELRFRVDIGTPDAGGVATASWQALLATGRSAKEISVDSPAFSAPLLFSKDGSVSTTAPANAKLTAEANAISLRPLDLVNVSFAGSYFLSGGKVTLACAEFDGTANVYITTGQPPDKVDLGPKGDFCLLTRVASEDEKVDPPKSAYHCP